MYCKSSYSLIHPKRSLQGQPYDPGDRVRVYICKNPKCAKRHTLKIRTIELCDDDLAHERQMHRETVKRLERELFELKMKVNNYTTGRTKITIDQLQHLLTQLLQEIC